MVDERLTPGVEDGEEAEACTEVSGVLGDLLKRLGNGTEQQIVDDPRVLERERCQGLGQREDHMGVGHGQHIGLARFEPARLCAALTLRAVTVATRVVRDPPVPAGVALVDVTPEPVRPAREDPVDDGTLLPAPLRGRSLASLEASVKDLGDLVSRSLAHLLGDDQLWAHRIQWTPRRTHPIGRHVRVDRRRSQRTMTQQRLDHPQVRARFHQMRRVAVT